MTSKANIRAESALSISQILRGKPFDGSKLPEKIERAADRDAGLYRELCFGTLREWHFLNALISNYLNKPIANKEQEVKALLAIGCYQLLFTRVPDHAAISTAVDGCKQLGKDWARGLVNAVLRNVSRDLNAIGLSEAECNDKVVQAIAKNKKLSDEKSSAIPAWLYQDFLKHWPDQASQIVSHARTAPTMTIRVLDGTRPSYLEKLSVASIGCRPSDLSKNAISLERGIAVQNLPGFDCGESSVQDAGAQLVTELLRIEDGDRVLDACAAPGGKTLALLQSAKQLNKQIELTAIDISPARLVKVQENLDRAGEQATLLAADATETSTWWKGISFDKILVDAPCSGSGVMNRYPDIKLLRRKQDIAGFAQQQLNLLNGLWPCLAEGGELLYCTCSILPAENSEVLSQFLTATSDAIQIPIDADWGIEQKIGRQLLPNKAENDGFFFAKIKKAHN